MNACTLPRTAELANRGNLETLAVDLTGCSRVELCVGLFEIEKAGAAFETWPDAVRKLMLDTLEAWRTRNPDAHIMCTSYAVASDAPGKRSCWIIVHYHHPRVPA
jgi:hypothetical protein